MAHIILSDEQLKSVQSTCEMVEVRDLEGHLVGYVAPVPSPQEILEAQQRSHSDGPWYSTEQVLNHLKSLEQG